MSRSLRVIRLGTIYLAPALFFCTTGGMASAATLCVNPGGTGGCTSTISAAVSAASPGDTIQVGPGIYKEQVTITKQLALVALDASKPPTIDAKGLSNGVFINGMSAAPGAGVFHVVISGFRIHNANFEGILIANASDTIIVGNHVFDNNKALDLSTSPVSCPGIPTSFETNEQMDCGEGIHLMSSDRSTIIQNEVDDNSGGILITDETGPTQLSVISGNFVHDNPYACGITMASHGPAPALKAMVSFGIFHNTVTNNESAHNGLGLPGAGAGIGIFAAGPGYRSSENVVINNFLHGNGLPGVTMHNHAAVAGIPVPPADLDNNVIVGNRIANNAADTEDAMTSGPTGINIFSKVPVHGTVISQNTFEDEAIDFALNVPAGSFVDAHFNNFSAGAIGVDNTFGGGHVSPTNNWWHCPSGPSGTGCATMIGNNGVVEPWLTSPFVP